MLKMSLLPLAFLLVGCGGLISFRSPPPPPSLTVPCEVPVLIPDSALNDQQIELLWGRDRFHLRECGNRHAALRAHVFGERR